MATLEYGYVDNGVPPDYGTNATDYQRAYIPNNLTQTVIFYEMTGRFGRYSATTPSVRMGIGDTTNFEANGSPDDLLGYTNVISPSTQMITLSGGAFYTRSLLTPFIGLSGRSYALVITSANAALGYGMKQSLALPGGTINHNFYTRSNGSSIPTNPIGGSASIEGHIQIWAKGEINVAPNTPTSTTPVGSVASTDLTPLMTSVFFDDNITLPDGQTFDYVNQVQIQVRRKSDQVSFWDHTYTATSGERTAHATSKEYAGTAIVAGTDYEQRFRHSDRAGSWSAYSAWVTFNINPGGSIVVTSATPTGKQNTQTPGPFVAQWTHVTPLNAKAAEIRIKDLNGSVIASMAAPFTLGAQVTNGNNISLTWANTGLTTLPRGTNGTWEMRAQDTGNAWSPWSAGVPISINATPNIPASLSPTSPWTSSSLPLITALASDADDLPSAQTLTVEIKRADTTTTTKNMPYNGTTGKHEYQVLAADVQTTFQTWQWRVKASDGTSESAYTAYQTFVYGAGPTVTVTSPTDEQALTTSTHRITWTVPTNGPQAKRRVRVYEVTAGDVAVPDGYNLDSTLQSTVDLFYDIANLRNARRYYAYVEVENATPLLGSSLPFQFTTAFTPPATITSFTAEPVAVHVRTGSDSVLLRWSASTYPAAQFQGYRIYRWELSEAGVRENRILLRTITNPVQTVFLDGNPISGQAYEYEIVQVIRVGLDDLVSASVYATISIDIPHLVLSSALLPESYGVELSAKVGRAGYLESVLQQDKKKVVPINAQKPRSIRTNLFAWTDAGSFELLSDEKTSAGEKVHRVEAMAQSGGTLNLRDFEGLQRFVTIDSLKFDRYNAAHYRADFKFHEEYFVEGESADGN